VTPDISVCIANYNGVGVVERCIESILQQTLHASFEVIIYDDASSDDSVAKIKKAFPQVRVIAGEKNIGYAEANNKMASSAAGQFLLLLNNDAHLPPDALSTLYGAAQSEPPQILTLCQLHSESGEVIDHGMGMDYLFVPYPLRQADDARLITAIGACLWVPRNVFETLGGFPPWFGSIAEDLYLCLRARTIGIETKVIDGFCYYHNAGHSFGGSAPGREKDTTYRRRRLSERNRLWIMLMFVPTALLPISILAWMLVWTVECIVLCISTLSASPMKQIYLPALIETFKNAREIALERQHIQAKRTVSWRWFFSPVRLLPTKLDFLVKHGLPSLK
jgi:GT2 family glycosyltransferase